MIFFTNHVVCLLSAGELHSPHYLMVGLRQRLFVLLPSIPHFAALFCI
ncbi:hypothetical protein BS78_07G093300 [Paspalum vaginatum]|nr:hypothetical protein BS78_07G093300 [Paspalum vaginatum]